MFSLKESTILRDIPCVKRDFPSSLVIFPAASASITSQDKMAEEEAGGFWFTELSSMSKQALRQCVAKWEFLENKYKEHMLKNPDIASKIESSLRLLSYVLPGRFGTSEALAELIYSASQLITLMHDGVFRQGKGIRICNSVKDGGKLVLLLTVVEYLEVFIELGAERVLGEAGKWVIVIVLQIFKAALRFFLLFRYKSGIQCSPLIPPLDRSEILKNKKDGNEKESTSIDETNGSTDGKTEAPNPVWEGARTRRRMRTLTAAPTDGFRTWSLPPLPQEKGNDNQSCVPTELSSKRLLGESLYISRPLIHLSSMFMFGEKSWKPWILSCATDVSSLVLLGDSSDLNAVEKAEISRRSLLLLFYLLRSPFYDTYSKTRVIGVLRYLSDTIPGVSLVLTPLLEYLPTWQKIYFYNWST